MSLSRIADVPAFAPRTTLLNVVVETSVGASVKLKYDAEAGVFRTHKAMPVGFELPFSLGFVPNTVAGDGDPLDVLLLSRHAIPVGSVVFGRILSVLEAEQVEGKDRNRNDRIIAAPWDTVANAPMLPEISFDKPLKQAITEFFKAYNEAQGKEFRALRFAPARRGFEIVRKAMKSAKDVAKKSNGAGRAGHAAKNRAG
jgi:inorganic pyrophosphatase